MFVVCQLWPKLIPFFEKLVYLNVRFVSWYRGLLWQNLITVVLHQFVWFICMVDYFWKILNFVIERPRTKFDQKSFRFWVSKFWSSFSDNLKIFKIDDLKFVITLFCYNFIRDPRLKLKTQTTERFLTKSYPVSFN